MPEAEAQSQDFQAQAFQADVAKLLHLMVHSVYSDRDIFLRELLSNAADACEKLRYEALADPAIATDAFRHPDQRSTRRPKRLAIEDNGIGMSRQTISPISSARSRGPERGHFSTVLGPRKAAARPAEVAEGRENHSI